MEEIEEVEGEARKAGQPGVTPWKYTVMSDFFFFFAFSFL